MLRWCGECAGCCGVVWHGHPIRKGGMDTITYYPTLCTESLCFFLLVAVRRLCMLLDFVECCCAQDTVWSCDSCAGCGVCMALDAEWNCEAWVRCGPCMAVGCCEKLCCVGVLWCLHGNWMLVELLCIGMLCCACMSVGCCVEL